jgi:hypothetical protein
MNTIPMQLSSIFLFVAFMAIFAVTSENHQKQTDLRNQEISYGR